MYDHVLSVGISKWGPVWMLTCAHEPGEFMAYDEGSWPDAYTCRCDDPECPCRHGDHLACRTIGGYVLDQARCRCVEMDECWASLAFVDLALDDATWEFPEGSVSIPANVRVSGGWDDFTITYEEEK